MPPRPSCRAQARARRLRALVLCRLALCLSCCLAPLGAPPAATPPSPQAAAPVPPQQAAATAAEIVLAVTVTDGPGRYVTGLGGMFFSVTDGKAGREITSFREAGDEPVSVALVFDVSGSMRDFLPAMKAAAARLVAAGQGANEYFVGEFGGEGGLRVLADWTNDRRAVAAALGRLALANSKDGKPKPQGRTLWHDACADAVAKLPGASHARRALVLLGDSEPDGGSRTGDGELKRKVGESGALFYAVSAIKNGMPYPYAGGQAVLTELTQRSGGRAYYALSVAELNEVADRIALELSHQYLVGFSPANAAGAGKWNKVKVRVAKPPTFKGSLNVRSREGYYSPPAAAPPNGAAGGEP